MDSWICFILGIYCTPLCVCLVREPQQIFSTYFSQSTYVRNENSGYTMASLVGPQKVAWSVLKVSMEAK